MRAGRTKLGDYLAAAAIVVAFGGLFFGRLMLFPVTLAEGHFLQRVAAKAQWWHVGHQVLLVGMLSLIGASLALRRTFRDYSPRLVDWATGLVIFGAALGVGQYALDFAMSAAAQIESTAAADQFLTALESDSFVQTVFYKLTDVGQAGLFLFVIALWRAGPAWRVQAVLVTLAAALALIGPQVAGAWGIRAGLGVSFVAFSTVAWKIAVGGNVVGEAAPDSRAV
jgi:hypothetical protein